MSRIPLRALVGCTLGMAAALGGCADQDPVAPPATTTPAPRLADNRAASTRVTDHGAIPNDAGDDTQYIQAAILAARQVYIPTGVYRVSANIDLPPGTEVFGDGAGSVLQITNGNPYVFHVLSSGPNPNGILVQHLGFQGSGGTQTAVRVFNGHNVTVRYNTMQGMAIIVTGASQPTDDVLSSGITVDRNVGVGPAGQWGGVALSFTKNATVTNNTISGYNAGVEWWGGEADPNKAGYVAGAFRAARDIHIENNNISNIPLLYAGGGGCIAGSLGERIVVVRNQVRYCDDVGLDAEGSYDVQFNENQVRDVKNAALAVFFYSSNVRFAWNFVEQRGWGSGGEGTTLFGTTNPSLVESGIRDIRLHNNHLVYLPQPGEQTTGQVVKNASESLYFSNNRLEDVVIDFGGCWSQCQYNGYVEVSGNTLDFKGGINIGRDAIRVGHNWGRASWTGGNTITAPAGQSGAGIVLDQSTSQYHWIMSNTIRGFATAVKLQGAGTYTVDGNWATGGLDAGGNTPAGGNNQWYQP